MRSERASGCAFLYSIVFCPVHLGCHQPSNNNNCPKSSLLSTWKSVYGTQLKLLFCHLCFVWLGLVVVKFSTLLFPSIRLITFRLIWRHKCDNGEKKIDEIACTCNCIPTHEGHDNTFAWKTFRKRIPTKTWAIVLDISNLVHVHRASVIHWNRTEYLYARQWLQH